jgi:hypothetical protein
VADTCGNSSPYSPRCKGRSCKHLQIVPGTVGEWFISRVENYGNSAQASHGGGDSTDASNPNDDGSGTDNTHSGTRNYGENEFAEIYLPANGRITSVYKDLGTGDTLSSQQAPAGASTAVGDVGTTTQFTNGESGRELWSII